MKQKTYEKENAFLSPYAKKSAESAGRVRQEEPCTLRTEFQRDRDRIIYSKAFLRLKNKTQVFFAPDGDHYMSRLTHTLDVSQIARSIARGLSLNEDLTEAISLGHDLGHTPFGHVGERVLSKLSPNGFKHSEQSLRVVDVLEKDGKGLNLTFEVRDGIVNHTKSGKPATLEGAAVSLADRIAYINHDIEDAIRAGFLKAEELPKDAVEVFGRDTSERINTAILDIFHHSNEQPFVKMSDEKAQALDALRSFMFEHVYERANKLIQESAERMLTELYTYFMGRPEELPPLYFATVKEGNVDRAVCDYLSSMTDKYAISVFKTLFVPREGSV
ncbi:MAG: deoxyguanosinetriphosphate triphosphohydrolase [Clostridiales bacterium]|nr:deoxyguanosinetriphosphate triphosphohydrolase [Clostridiales bacterium]